MSMTEIFYRLLSQANGSLFLLEKAERFNCVQQIVDTFLIEEERSRQELSFLKKTKGIMKKYLEMDFHHPTNYPTIQERRSLAIECLNVKMDVYEHVENKLQGIDYKTISNKAFSELIHSDLTNYFYIALFMAECRGKLLEYLLVHKK